MYFLYEFCYRTGMKGIKRLIVSIGIIICTGVLYGQTKSNPSTPFLFDLDTWNFGEIEETGGKVSYTFHFTNTSSKPKVIEHVSMSCGCTTASYSKQPIMPGKDGEIKITFDPVKQPGTFKKNIRVTTDNGKCQYNLSISGVVNPRTLKIDEQYPYRLTAKGLQLDAIKANFGYVTHNIPQKKIIRMVNTSDKTIHISIHSIGKESGKLSMDYPKTLKPGEKGTLTLTYSIKNNTFGTLADKLEISVQGIIQTQVITVEGIAVEKTDRSNSKKPQLRYQPSFVNFGKQTTSKTYTAEIEMYNDGNAPLIIRHLEYKGNVSIGLTPGTTIAPKKKKTITLKFTPPANGKGEIEGGVSIISNDPNRPMREIRCKVNIN